MPKRKKGKAKRYDQIVLAGIVIALIAISVYLWGPLHKPNGSDDKKRPAQAKKQEPPTASFEGRPVAKKQPSREPAELKPRAPKLPEKTVLIAIVIDDLGHDLKSAQEILELPASVTLSVMPQLPQSKQVAEIARRSGREVLLHLPMEPKNQNKRMAPGTLRVDMTPMEFITALNNNIDSVPGAAGVNNHEGSALTENREAMTFLMSELKNRNLFFLDSLTSPGSLAYSTAKEFGLKAARRAVFLDNENNNPGYIRSRLEELAQLAKKRGSAIGIGHPHPATISELRKWLTEADEQGIEIVPVSRIVK